MSQWGQGQPGYQYPMQTGYPGGNPQFQQQQPNQQQFQQMNPQMGGQMPQQQGSQFQPGMGQQMGGIMPQRTGFPGQQPQGFQVPQQTGFPGQGMLQAQATGFHGSFQQQQHRAAPPPPPVPSLPPQFQGQNQPSFLNAPPQQPNRFMSSSPGLGATPLQAQATGFPGARPLVPQATGFVDPRLQMMSSTFMPANTSTPYSSSGAPMLPSQRLQSGLNLQQSFQQHNQDSRGTAAPRVPWALSKSEKKQYDNIFRAWDQKGTGFISGNTALEVFGQSGLSKDDLARVWYVPTISNVT
jgi:actin cytoskeleton-regulatory complex protein PAN1